MGGVQCFQALRVDLEYYKFAVDTLDSVTAVESPAPINKKTKHKQKKNTFCLTLLWSTTTISLTSALALTATLQLFFNTSFILKKALVQ